MAPKNKVVGIPVGVGGARCNPVDWIEPDLEELRIKYLQNLKYKLEKEHDNK